MKSHGVQSLVHLAAIKVERIIAQTVKAESKSKELFTSRASIGTLQVYSILNMTILLSVRTNCPRTKVFKLPYFLTCFYNSHIA